MTDDEWRGDPAAMLKALGIDENRVTEASADLVSILEEKALILDHRSSADELVTGFPDEACAALAGFRIGSFESDPFHRVRLEYDGEAEVVRLGRREEGSPFDRVFARIEDLTGGQLVTYGLHAYLGTDSYAYIVLHEARWEELRDALGHRFDDVFVGDYAN